jgi:hypothetical protein
MRLAAVHRHTIDDVAQIYDRHDYSAEKRAALSRLADCLEEIFSLKSRRPDHSITRVREVASHSGNN